MLAVHRTIVVVDVEGFGSKRRTNRHQVAVRDGLYRSMREAFRRAGIPWGDCDHEDRGDGILIRVPAELPKGLLVESLPFELVNALHTHNSAHPAQAQIRLGIALHAGEVNYNNHGVTAGSINLAFRLLDSFSLKEALAGYSGVLAVITSSWFYEEVVRHSPVATVVAYHSVPVAVKETMTTGSICLRISRIHLVRRSRITCRPPLIRPEGHQLWRCARFRLATHPRSPGAPMNSDGLWPRSPGTTQIPGAIGVAGAVRPAEFSDLQGLIQGLSTGIQGELAKLDKRESGRPVRWRRAGRCGWRRGRCSWPGGRSCWPSWMPGWPGMRTPGRGWWRCAGWAARARPAWRWSMPTGTWPRSRWPGSSPAEDPAVLAAGFGELAAQLGAADGGDPVASVHGVLAAARRRGCWCSTTRRTGPRWRRSCPRPGPGGC